jgi:hypothetical protein
MCDFLETSAKTALTLALSHREREPERSEKPFSLGRRVGRASPHCVRRAN